LPKSPLAATAPTRTGPPSHPLGSPNKPRPAAPAVSFLRRGQTDPPSASPAEPGSTGVPPTVPCAQCGSANQRGLRFCMACGHLLAEDSAPGDAGSLDLGRTVTDIPKPEATPPPSRPAIQIAPARVIDVGPAMPRPNERLCPRCQGPRDPGAQFCRFCGAPLAAQLPAVGTAAAVALPEVASPPIAAGSPQPAVIRRATVAPTPARVTLITRDGSEGPSYALGPSTDVGRSEGDIVFPDDGYISPRHARIASRGGVFFIRDLETTNGVFVRIPFAVSSSDARGAGSAGGAQGTGGREITIRGHHTQDPVRRVETAAPEANESASEQPLADQELFLLGQQVLRFEVVKEAEEAFGAASENGTLLFGTPAAPRYARLSQRTVEGVVRDVLHVRKAETVIGRESGDVVFTDDPFLSRRHAVLRMRVDAGRARRFALADLGSSNGTFLRIREEVRLRHGDHLRIGQQLLRFDFDAADAGV
jgi:pSer/pThr/pTyr-binding forkhead associated (FHA) protein